MDWVVAKGYEGYIPSLLWEKTDQPEDFPECRLLKRSILRTSFLTKIDLGRHDTIFVKRHHRKNRQDDLRNLVMPSRACNEWKVLLQFKRLGLPAPEPLAYGEKRRNGVLRESCVVTGAILSAQPLSSLLSQTGCLENRSNEEKLIDSLAHLIGRLHNAGVYFRDLHGGNVIARFDHHKNPEIFFVDTDKARFAPSIKCRNRIADLTLLYVSVFQNNAPLWEMFLSIYFRVMENRTITEQEIDTAVHEGAQRYVHRRLKSRSKRCLKNSTSFGVKKEKRSTLYVRKSVPLSLIQEALEQARPAMTALRESSAGRTTLNTASLGKEPERLFQVTGHTYTLGEQLLSMFRRTTAKQAWVNGNALLVRKIDTFQPIALYEQKGLVGINQSVLLAQAFEKSQPIGIYFRQRFLYPKNEEPFRRRCRFITAFGESVGSLTQKQIFFSSLTVNDVFVEEIPNDSWRFLYAYDKNITFDRPVALDKQRISLLQLHTSLEPAIKNRDRLHFLCSFTRHLPRKQRKDFIRYIIRKAAKKD